MAHAPAFELWLEFEYTEQPPDYDPTVDFANVAVTLPDGRRYAMNVCTFGFMRLARYPWPYEEGVGERAEYLRGPDLFVERLDRPTLEWVVEKMLAAGQMKPEWLCPPEEPDD